MLTVKQSLYSMKSTLLTQMLNRKGALPFLKAYDRKHHPERVREWYEIKRITKKEDPYFLVFRSHPTDGFNGLGSYLLSFLAYLKLHETDNFIPVVDFQASPPKTLYDDKPENRNYWEDYFKQPAGVSVEEAMNSNNYVLSGTQDRTPGLHDITKRMIDSVLTGGGGGYLATLHGLQEKYVHLNKKMEEKLSLAYEELFAESKERGEKIVGVKLRVTDYVEMIAPGHPFQPTTEKMIKKVERFIKDYRYDKVFLAVDDIHAREAFQRAFGDKLIHFPAPLMDYSERSRVGNDDVTNNSAGYVAKSQLGAIQAQEAYLIELLLLTSCDSLLAGVSSGTIYSIIAKNGEYEHLEILNSGKSKYWYEKREESK